MAGRARTTSRWRPGEAGSVVISLEERKQARVQTILHDAALAHGRFEALPRWRRRARYRALETYHDLHQEAKAIARGES